MSSWVAELDFPSLAGERVLVTGATGFIGSHLCHALAGLGAEVHGLARTTGRAETCRLWPVDLVDREQVRAVVDRVRPRFVFHLAGLVTARPGLELVLPMLHNNLLGTVHLLLALAGTDRCEQVVMTGSSEELGGPTSPYATAKAAAGLYAAMFWQLYDLPVVMARLYMSYGPGQEETKLIPYTIVSLLRGQNPRLGDGRRICDFVYVLDVVRGLLEMAIRPGLAGQTVDLGCGREVSIREAVELVAELIPGPGRPEFGARPNRPQEQEQVADRAALKRQLGWEPSWSLRAGLLETVAWYRARLEE